MIRGESRLLQHTASTYLKTRDSPLKSRESLSLNTAPASAPSPVAPLFNTPSHRPSLPNHVSVNSSLEASTTSRRGTDSPSRHTAEAYQKHFQGAGVSEVFAPLPSSIRRGSNASMGGVGQHRINDDSNNTFSAAFSPTPSPLAGTSQPRATSPYRSLRGQPPRQEPLLFGSSADDFVEPSQRSSRAQSPTRGAKVGMWTAKEGNNNASFTGSRRHFQNEGVSSRPCSPVRSSVPSLDASLSERDSIRVYPQSYEEEAARRGKRVNAQPNGIQGSSCEVVGRSYEGKPFDAKGRVSPKIGSPAATPRSGSPLRAPYAQLSDPTTGGAPPPHAPATKDAKPSILEHRDGRDAWKATTTGASSSSPRGRSTLPPPPPSVAQLGASQPNRPSSIRAMAGAPPFVPPEMPARRGSPSRRQSPTRAESVTLSNNGAGNSLAPTPRSTSPVIVGRGVGLYSPLRQRNSSIFC